VDNEAVKPTGGKEEAKDLLQKTETSCDRYYTDRAKRLLADM